MVESINIAMTPRQPLGMTPSALGLSADGKRLFVACSDANAAAVIDIAEGRSRVEGFIPTGWYPTAVRALANGLWWCSTARDCVRTPTARTGRIRPARRTGACRRACAAPVQFVGPHADRHRVVDRTLHRGAARNRGPRARWPTRLIATPSWTRASPLPKIEHVIYIVKENRSYDQVFGDMKEGNGDASLVLFGEKVTPNHHKLAREFVLLDNFYVNERRLRRRP